MLEKTGWIILVKLWHVLRLHDLLLSFLRLLVDLKETRVLRQKLTFEVKLQVNIRAIIFSDKILQIKSIESVFVLYLDRVCPSSAILSRPLFLFRC